MKIEIKKTFKFFKKKYITILLIIKFNTELRNVDQVHFFKLIKELNNALKSKYLYPQNEGQKMEKECKVLKATIYHQKRSKHRS